MRLGVELGLDFVARIARTPAVLLARILGERIPALDHEAFDDAMEGGPVIETGPGEFLEILDRARRHIGPEFNDHFSGGGLDHRYFIRVCAHNFGCFFLWFFGLVFLLLLAATDDRAQAHAQQAGDKKCF